MLKGVDYREYGVGDLLISVSVEGTIVWVRENSSYSYLEMCYFCSISTKFTSFISLRVLQVEGRHRNFPVMQCLDNKYMGASSNFTILISIFTFQCTTQSEFSDEMKLLLNILYHETRYAMAVSRIEEK